MRARWIAAFVVLGAAGVFGVTLRARAEGPAAEGDAVLEFVVDVVRTGVDPAPLVAATTRADAAQPGFVARGAARGGADGTRLLRATVWASLPAAEAAALAADGRADVVALDAAVDGAARTTLHARRLRAHAYDAAPGAHLEVTVFRTRPGTTREANLAKFDAAEADFSKAAGLLGHELYLAPDGRWVHVVRWRSEADFSTTGKALMKTSGVGGWIRSLDYGRFTVWRGDRLGG